MGLTLALVAMLVARRVLGMDKAVGCMLSELPPPGDLHLAAAPPLAPAESQMQWGTLVPPAMHPLLCTRLPTRPPLAFPPNSTRGLRRRTRRRARDCATT